MSETNLALLPQKEYNDLRNRTAMDVHAFLRDVISETSELEVTLDRDKLILYLDAFRSKKFMDLVENDPDLPYDIKVQFSKMNTGLNKTWPAIRTMVNDPAVLRFAAVAHKLLTMLETVERALGIDVFESITIEPTELPPPE